MGGSAVDDGDELVEEGREVGAAPHDAVHALTLAEDLDELLEDGLEGLSIVLREGHEGHDLHAPVAPRDRRVRDADRDGGARRGHAHRVRHGEGVGEGGRRELFALDRPVDVLRVDDAEIETALLQVMDLSPSGIRKHLDLNKPIYAKTAAYGHFGRKPGRDGSFSWERTNLAKPLKAALGVK